MIGMIGFEIYVGPTVLAENEIETFFVNLDWISFTDIDEGEWQLLGQVNVLTRLMLCIEIGLLILLSSKAVSEMQDVVTVSALGIFDVDLIQWYTLCHFETSTMKSHQFISNVIQIRSNFLILAIEKFQHLEELISTFRADWTKAMILLEKMNKIQTSFWACSLMVTPLSSSLPAAPQVVPIHSSNTFFFLLCWPGLQHHLLSWPGPQHQHTSFSSTPLLARSTAPPLLAIATCSNSYNIRTSCSVLPSHLDCCILSMSWCKSSVISSSSSINFMCSLHCCWLQVLVHQY